MQIESSQDEQQRGSLPNTSAGQHPAGFDTHLSTENKVLIVDAYVLGGNALKPTLSCNLLLEK